MSYVGLGSVLTAKWQCSVGLSFYWMRTTVADGLAALDAHSLSHVKLHCDPFTGPVDALLNADFAATNCSKGFNFQ